MADKKRDRGRPVALPEWWLSEVRQRFATAQEQERLTKVELGKQLAEAVGRKKSWDHKAVERFLDNTTTTFEMMRGFIKIWPSLVQPVFVAPTREIAERIQDFLRRGDSNPDWRERYMELNERLQQIAAPLLDQTARVESDHEGQEQQGRPGGRRHPRVD